MIELTLPWPQSVNHYKKVGGLIRTKTGKMFQKRVNTNETNLFYYQVWMRVKPRIPPEGFLFRNDGTIRLYLEVDLHPPHTKRYDADNYLKVLLDSLTNAKVWADDSQVHRLLVEKKTMVEGGQVIVRISELNRVI